jgi:hypothetical protein
MVEKAAKESLQTSYSRRGMNNQNFQKVAGIKI